MEAIFLQYFLTDNLANNNSPNRYEISRPIVTRRYCGIIEDMTEMSTGQL